MAWGAGGGSGVRARAGSVLRETIPAARAGSRVGAGPAPCAGSVLRAACGAPPSATVYAGGSSGIECAHCNTVYSGARHDILYYSARAHRTTLYY